MSTQRSSGGRRGKPKKTFRIGEARIRPGETRDLKLKVSETYSGAAVTLPVRVIRAQEPGPTVFVSGAVHGDELNGMGIIRALMFREPPQLTRGTLLLVPVVNILGFERHSRYLPDRRDLNRSFPGYAEGSLASRIAGAFFEAIVRPCDFGIDLHTAAVRRTNYPNVRADLSIPAVARLAHAFGSGLIVDGRGPQGSLRRAACQADCPTIILEAGEPWKIEPGVVRIGVRGVRNVLSHLDMLDQPAEDPDVEVVCEDTTWVRASAGGVLQFHVAPGEAIEVGQPLATSTNLLGDQNHVLLAPVSGVILGMTTMPSVKPGDPVCHIATPADGYALPSGRAVGGRLHRELREALATSLSVSPLRTDQPAEWAGHSGAKAPAKRSENKQKPASDGRQTSGKATVRRRAGLAADEAGE